MPTALAISPHLDDAIFSAGGTLARLARQGWRVIVATVFTASVPEPGGFALACQLDKGLPADVDYMALRRAEDESACAEIGAEPRWLPFAEAPHRGYHSAEALFGRLGDDDRIVDALAPVLTSLVRDISPDVLFSPQAVGAHVDHVAVHLALHACDRPRWLWTDFPYVIRPVVRASPFSDAFRGLSVREIALGRDELYAKAEAVMAYASQVGFQFGAPEAARSAIATYGAVEGFVKSGLVVTREPPFE